MMKEMGAIMRMHVRPRVAKRQSIIWKRIEPENVENRGIGANIDSRLRRLQNTPRLATRPEIMPIDGGLP